MFIGGERVASYRTSWNGGTLLVALTGGTLVALTGGTYWWYLLVALIYCGTYFLVALTGVFEARRCEEKQQQTLLHEALYTKNRKQKTRQI